MLSHDGLSDNIQVELLYLNLLHVLPCIPFKHMQMQKHMCVHVQSEESVYRFNQHYYLKFIQYGWLGRFGDM